MFKEVLSQTELVALPVFAMLLFATVFVVVVVRVWRRGPDDPEHARLSRLPLADDDPMTLQEGETHG